MKPEDRATDITINESGIIWNWNAKHILADKYRMLEFGKLLFAVLVMFIVLMGFIVVFVDGGMGELQTALYISIAAIGGFGVLIFVALALVGHVFHYQFGVSDKSVFSRMFTGKMKDAANGIVVLAAMMENPQAMGQGILAKTDEYVEISFADMTNIKWYPDDCVIKFKGTWYSKPFYMDCPPHLYHEIEAKIRAGLKAAHNDNFLDELD
ncbi:hypothetical protein [Maridesulfovibrio salexigens]|uniref:YcxB-like protein n=1 Tax=Maridesulfovibrio salexigens (strain ATCC 14822 / DSM 2638 / NCIMB 8403 / VKM B-1763) TaxID=526222 RepID=C6BXB3_MARSD|nr:hypothetical protein [Maridesulfovibrio salexigens]ACS80419.1 hypothetical protein Desal_2363 [Maridesulfovibrio salexigens DSM 2638]